MVLNKFRISFGTDAEFFIRDAQTNTFIPARLVTSGTKTAYEKIPGGTIHADGLAVEIGIDKVYTAAGFASKLDQVMSELRMRCDANGWRISDESMIKFTEAEWATFTDDEKEVGCNPDFTLYKGKYEPKAATVLQVNDNPADKLGRIRTVGGHLHIGWTDGQDVQDPYHVAVCKAVIRACDFAFENHLGDTERTAYYGGFGCFRPKPYGVEYRGADSRWLADSAARIKAVEAELRAINKSGNGLALFKLGGMNVAA